MTSTELTVHLGYLRDITILADSLSRVASRIYSRETNGHIQTPLYRGLLDKRDLLLDQIVKLTAELRNSTPQAETVLERHS